MAPITKTMPIITNIAQAPANSPRFSTADQCDLPFSRFAALLQRRFGAPHDRLHRIVVMRWCRSRRNRDPQHVSPPGNPRVLHHLLQALPDRRHVAYTAFQEDGEELVLFPVPDEIRGAQT